MYLLWWFNVWPAQIELVMWLLQFYCSIVGHYVIIQLSCIEIHYLRCRLLV